MDNRTLLNAWEAFEVSGYKDISLCQSALFRFTLPGLGGCRPTGSRLGSKEIAAALKMLSSILITADTVECLREAQKQAFTLLNTPKQRQRQPRYYLNQFIDWSIKNNFFPSVNLLEEKQNYIFYPEKVKRIKTTNRQYVHKKITFSFDLNDYPNELLKPEQIHQHLQRINQEFVAFKKDQITTQGIRLATVNKRERDLKQILGWLYREKGIPLAEISLSRLVPLINLKISISSFSSEENPLLSKLIAEAKALENIKNESKRLVSLLKEYFVWSEHPLSPSTKQICVEALIAYSKYVYSEETDKAMALNFEDIPLINRLKVFQKDVGKGNKNSSSSISKYLPWSDVLEVLEKLRFEANLETIRRGEDKDRQKRPLLSRAKSLQSFILLGFFVLVPPSRQRVIRELELGRTLKYGIFENGRFTSFEKMANPSEAKYYIDLKPEDYKTGNTYGEWQGVFPNTEFSDGSKFYDYLNRWFFQGYQDKNSEWHGMRNLIALAGEKTVFIRENIGDVHDAITIRQKIKRIFLRWAGIPITPQDLRHLYRTYIDDPATGATPEEKESAAYWMRHSSQMAAKTYSHLDNEQKLRAGAQLSSRINQSLLKS